MSRPIQPFLTVFACIILAGCDGSQSKSNSAPSALDEIEADSRIRNLQEYADRRMNRLLTPTGVGLRKLDWDLTVDNQIARVGWPEIEQTDEYILNQDIELVLQLPDHITFTERGTLLICRRESDARDRVHRISFQLPSCTADDAYRIARQYIQRWKLERNHSTEQSLDSLDEWRAEAKRSGYGSFIAARHNNYPLIDLEIHQSFNESKPWFVSFAFSVGRTPLPAEVVACFESIRKGDEDGAIALLNKGVDPGSTNVLDDSLLHAAAEHGRLTVARELLRRGAEVDVKGGYEQTPLWAAVLHGQLELASFLLEHKAAVNTGDGKRGTILHYVSEYVTEPVSNDQLVLWLLDHQARVDVVDARGETPLHKAARKGHLPAARVLIEHGANVNALNNEKVSPLDYAQQQRQVEVQLLPAKHGAKRGRDLNTVIQTME
jgi:ankyrin repeat protein